MMRTSAFVLISAVLAVAASGYATAAEIRKPDAPANAAEHYRMVVQVSDNDPAKWNLALNNVSNVQSDLGAENVDIEIVAYGPGINMIKLESTVAHGVSKAIASGVRVVACENTMTNQKLTKDDMLSSLLYVPAGVVELMVRQRQGYAYIRP